MNADELLVRTGSLRSRLIRYGALVIIMTLTPSVAALYGVHQIHADSGAAVRDYREMRVLFEIGVHVNSAQAAYARGDSISAALAQLHAATTKKSFEPISNSQMLDASLDDAICAARAGQRHAFSIATSQAKSSIANLLAALRVDATARERSAERQRRLSAILVGAIAAIVICGVFMLLRRQYRQITRPIDSLADALEDLTAGKLGRRMAVERGDQEFVQLAIDFNTMAARLEALCADLSQQIQSKSRELIRSERLAGIGYLAAGVAHEINNPLAIIAGFGERSLQRLRRHPQLAPVEREGLDRSLAIICDEAFRCKAITDQLLNLARVGAARQRQTVSIAALAKDVVDSLAGLNIDRSASIRVQHSTNEVDVSATVNENEIKQVLLNLLLNAVAATRGRDARTSRIEVQLTRTVDSVRIVVSDNGVGMSQSALEHAFEPFFSQVADGKRGTGLGLSVSHAIITDHGGSIRAESDGPGLGSRFVVTIPRTARTVADASENCHVPIA